MNPFANRKFIRWCSEYDKKKFRLTDDGFSVPDSKFNRVFLLAHAFRHYVREGLGLRHVMDYYFLLLSLYGTHKLSNICLSQDDMIMELGMSRFEKAMRWVMLYVFEDNDVEVGRKCGKILLAHVMDGGSFGKYKTTSIASRHTHFGRFINQVAHTFRLMWYYPQEAVWVPISMVREFFMIRI